MTGHKLSASNGLRNNKSVQYLATLYRHWQLFISKPQNNSIPFLAVILWLTAIFLPLSFQTVFGQTLPQSSSQSWQIELTNRYSQLRQRTLQVAKQQRWALSKKYSNTREFQLQEIDAFGQPVYYTVHNVEAARGTRTQALWGGSSLPVALSGNSPALAGKLGLWDGGRVLTSHQEFIPLTGVAQRIIQKDDATAVNNHTTHLAGTLVAQGINPQAKGMAFGAQLSVWNYTDDITELTTAASNLLVSNHAYGPVAGWVYNASRPGADANLKWEWWGNTAISTTEDYLFGFYTTKARDIDRIAYNNPFYLMVRSADNKRSETGPPTGTSYFLRDTDTKSTLFRSRNDMYDVIPAEATAKNVLTVGAADATFAASQPVSITSTSYSGWGPTDDGRIKPDLLGIGSSVLSSIAQSDTAYAFYSGTSMASANVAGSLFLLQELFARQRATSSPGTTQFMRAATLRGLALHTADRMNPAAGPDYRQGWGLLNTEAAARIILNENLAHLLLEQSLIAGKTFTQQITAQGSEPLLITLSWTDPEGTATTVAPASVDNRAPKLVNDLDLRLSSGSTIDMPFVLDPSHPDQAAIRGDNFRDNIEQVYVANPKPGQTYTISVSHKGKMTYSSQPFSIIVSGLQRVNCQLTAEIQLAKDTTICAGTVLPLRTANPSADLTYQWLRNGVVLENARTDVCQVKQAGSYVLRVSNAAGCSSTSKPVQVQVRASSVAITPAGSQWLCADKQPIQLQAVDTNGATLSGVNVEWIRDSLVIASQQVTTLTITEPGRYKVRMTKDGCQSLSAETNVQPTTVGAIMLVPEETELTLPKGATVTLKAPVDSSYNYQWYRNDSTLTNAVNYQLAVSQAGIYKVQIIQQHCVGWSANRLVESSVLTDTVSDSTSHFVVYPNPVERTLLIKYIHPLAKQAQLSIFDMRGVLQQEILVQAQHGQFETELTVQTLPPGYYIVRLTGGFTTQVGRFLKK
jgi:hypothetical protein